MWNYKCFSKLGLSGIDFQKLWILVQISSSYRVLNGRPYFETLCIVGLKFDWLEHSLEIWLNILFDSVMYDYSAKLWSMQPKGRGLRSFCSGPCCGVCLIARSYSKLVIWMAPWKNRTSQYISSFHPSLNGVLFPMFCLVVEE